MLQGRYAISILSNNLGKYGLDIQGESLLSGGVAIGDVSEREDFFIQVGSNPFTRHYYELGVTGPIVLFRFPWGRIVEELGQNLYEGLLAQDGRGQEGHSPHRYNLQLTVIIMNVENPLCRSVYSWSCGNIP